MPPFYLIFLDMITLANWFSTLGQSIQKHFPNTVSLNPFSTEGLIFLITTGMMGRLIVGTTRTVADTPLLNPNDDQSPEQKTRIQLERVFMEFVGVPINFLVLKFCEDLGEYGAIGVDRKLLPTLGNLFGKTNWGNTINPGHWLGGLTELNEADKKTVAQGLVYTFNPAYRKPLAELKKQQVTKHPNKLWHFDPQQPCFEKLTELSVEQCQELLLNDWHTLSKNFNNGAKLSTLMQGLEQLSDMPEHASFSVDAFKNSPAYANLGKRFAANNIKTNLFLLGAGTLGSTLFSGVIWQYLNDSFIRKKLVPLVTKPVTRLYYGQHYSQQWEAEQALLFPDEPPTTTTTTTMMPPPPLLQETGQSVLQKHSQKPGTSYQKKALADQLNSSYIYSTSLLNFKL